MTAARERKNTRSCFENVHGTTEYIYTIQYNTQNNGIQRYRNVSLVFGSSVGGACGANDGNKPEEGKSDSKCRRNGMNQNGVAAPPTCSVRPCGFLALQCCHREQKCKGVSDRQNSFQIELSMPPTTRTTTTTTTPCDVHVPQQQESPPQQPLRTRSMKSGFPARGGSISEKIPEEKKIS